MRHSTGAKLMIFTMVFAVSLAANRCVRAGSPWGWKKPINQKLGAFYTSNKAFKRPKSTSRSYRQRSSYSTHSVNRTYTQPTYTQPTVQRVIVTSKPAPVASRPTAPISVPAVQEQVAPRSVNVTSSSNSRSVVSRPALGAPTSAKVEPANAKGSALNTAEAALKGLELGTPPVAKPPVAKPPVAKPPVAKPLIATPPTAAPSQDATPSPTVNKGAVRIKSPTQSNPLPFRSTTDKFWE